ncbi:hypothetical protein GCM10009827_092820 [Dactylosporangium maewongense]|uniref:Uncharacterized protein n=1 Tax=Dactylosporangium maewongense TaxID=634393 RepID=A0ABP4N7Y0_9ACTN
MELDLDAPAAEVLAADVVTTAKAGRWAVIRLFAAAAVQSLFDDSTGPGGPGTPTVYGHLVVTRRDTGEVVLAVPLELKPDLEHGDADYLGYVRRQLDELTAGEFLERWGGT